MPLLFFKKDIKYHAIPEELCLPFAISRRQTSKVKARPSYGLTANTVPFMTFIALSKHNESQKVSFS